MKRLFLLLVLGIFAFACNKDDDMPEPTDDYLVFGHFYGYCVGEKCVEIYKLEDEQLYEDVKDEYPTQTNPYEGNFKVLPDTTYQKVADLTDYFPQELFNSADTVIGIPNVSEQGRLYIERKTANQHRFWILDQNKNSIPTYTQEFHDEVNAAIERINE